MEEARTLRRTAPARTGWLATLLLGASALGCGAEHAGGASPLPAVRIERGAHPLAQASRDIGRLDPERRLGNLSIVFKLSPEAQRDRAALLADQLDPGSPEYHAWLTPEGYAARFGAAPADIARTVAWLESEGLDVVWTSRLGARVRFAGRVADVESAFQTEMHRYEVGGETHYAMATAPAIPAELSDVVLAVYDTHDFYARPLVRRLDRGPDYYAVGLGDGLAPSDWAAIYDVAPLYKSGVTGTPLDGTGITIAIAGESTIQQSDVDAFRSTFGLPPSTVVTTLVPGSGAAGSGCQGCGLEATLDVEWSGGIAPKAQINYVLNGDLDPDADDAAFYAIEESLAPIVSESFAGCEDGLTPSDADVLETYASAANLLGITYVAGSGDTGAAACYVAGGSTPPVTGMYVNIPAALPGVTAVGGTQFPFDSLSVDASGDVLGYSAQETAWNESDDPSSPQGLAATGGGISSVFARPAYQSAVPTCTPVGMPPTALPDGRQLPDVAVTAAASLYPYFITCALDFATEGCDGTSPEILPIGGTSAATPSFAGVLALLNQAIGERLGNVNPMLYALAQAAPSGFHDIATGDNEIQCTTGTDPGCAPSGLYGFPATAGYDCATGLGSIDAQALISAWASLTPTSSAIQAAPTQTSEGESVALTAAVTVDGAGTQPLGGTVTFTFQSYNAGMPDLSWTLGEVPIAGGTTTGGTAMLSTPIPPGLVAAAGESVDVVAMYGGDAHHLASTSAKLTIQIQAVDLAITPAMATVTANGMQTFSATGGVAPVQWFVDSDQTCDAQQNCSSIDQTTGVLTAGPDDGQVVIAAIDADGAEALATVMVTGGAVGTGGSGGTGGTSSVSGSGGSGGGTGGGSGGSMVVPHDAGTDGGGEPATSSGGCACGVAPREPSPAGALAVMALGLAVLRRRDGHRRRR